MEYVYSPITKEKAAEILSVSKRTIDNMLADGILPRPSYIGRRLYWHPATFFGWLDQRLGHQPNNHNAPPTAPRRPGRPRKSGR